VNLLVDQVEFCDVIVLNKTDLLDAAELERLDGLLKNLNPRADIVRARFGQVPLERILDTGRFDFAAAAEAPGWLAELRGEHVPETEEYGITSFVRARPLPSRALPRMDQPGVARRGALQGLLLAGQPPHHGGQLVPGRGGGPSRAGRPVVGRRAADRWPQDEEGLAAIRARWDDAVGDAQQELVLIGIDMDEAALRARLDACLLNDAEYASRPAAWTQLPDPFPAGPSPARSKPMDEHEEHDPGFPSPCSPAFSVQAKRPC
jgi:hypothetical protein